MSDQDFIILDEDEKKEDSSSAQETEKKETAEVSSSEQKKDDDGYEKICFQVYKCIDNRVCCDYSAFFLWFCEESVL